MKLTNEFNIPSFYTAYLIACIGLGGAFLYGGHRLSEYHLKTQQNTQNSAAECNCSENMIVQKLAHSFLPILLSIMFIL